MRKSANHQRTLQEILDSDDELETEYSETLYKPAYQDDTRFEYFEELKKSREKAFINETQIPSKSSENKVIKQGVFSKIDVLCLQCVQKLQSSTLLWFFEFLLHKDLQSKYKFLKPCLVPKYEQRCLRDFVAVNIGNTYSNKYNFKLLLKK